MNGGATGEVFTTARTSTYVLSEMESDQPNEEKHPTKAVTSEPQEEFIEEKARPSRDENEQAKKAPPKEEL